MACSHPLGMIIGPNDLADDIITAYEWGRNDRFAERHGCPYKKQKLRDAWRKGHRDAGEIPAILVGR